MLISKYVKINIDVSTTNKSIIHLKQNDNFSRIVIFQIYKNKEKFFVQDDMDVKYILKKPDGTYTIKQVDKENISYNEVKVIFNSSDLSQDGIMYIEFVIIKNDIVVSSQVVKVNVVSNSYTKNDIESSDDYQSFIDALNKIEPALEDIKNATDDARLIATQVPEINQDLKKQIDQKLNLSIYENDKTNFINELNKKVNTSDFNEFKTQYQGAIQILQNNINSKVDTSNFYTLKATIEQLQTDCNGIISELEDIV